MLAEEPVTRIEVYPLANLLAMWAVALLLQSLDTGEQRSTRIRYDRIDSRALTRLWCRAPRSTNSSETR